MNYKYLFWLVIGLIIGYIFKINNIEGFKGIPGCPDIRESTYFNHALGNHIDNTRNLTECNKTLKIKIHDFFIQYTDENGIKTEEDLLMYNKFYYLRIFDIPLYEIKYNFDYESEQILINKKILYINLDEANPGRSSHSWYKMKIEFIYGDINRYDVYLFDWHLLSNEKLVNGNLQENDYKYIKLISNTFEELTKIFTLYDKDNPDIYITLEIIPDNSEKLTKEKIKTFIYDNLTITSDTTLEGDQQTPINPCEPNPCQNGGTCSINRSGLYTCNCSGYRGENCQYNPCEPNPCKNGGTCSVRLDGDYTCECPDSVEDAVLTTNDDSWYLSYGQGEGGPAAQRAFPTTKVYDGKNCDAFYIINNRDIKCNRISEFDTETQTIGNVLTMPISQNECINAAKKIANENAFPSTLTEEEKNINDIRSTHDSNGDCDGRYGGRASAVDNLRSRCYYNNQGHYLEYNENCDDSLENYRYKYYLDHYPNHKLGTDPMGFNSRYHGPLGSGNNYNQTICKVED